MKKQREAFEKYWRKNTTKDVSTLFGCLAWHAWQAAQADKLDFARKVALALQKAIVSELNAMDVCNCCNDASDIPEYCAETAGDINDEDIAVIIAKVEQEK